MSIDFRNVPHFIRRELQKTGDLIRQRHRGNRVKRLQEWLRYHECRTVIDGIFGPATAACVKQFQQMKGLRDTGSVNGVTWDALVQPMRDSLKAPANISSLTPPKAVRAVAQQHLDQHPIEIGGSNRGPWVRLYCSGNDGPAWAWCAGFVTLIFQQAYFYLGQNAPIKGSVSCDSLAAQARHASLFVHERDLTSGRTASADFGDACIFLKRRTNTDWTHTGFALDFTGTRKELTFSTIEGNTNDDGSRDGYEACSRTRSVAISNYDFISLS